MDRIKLIFCSWIEEMGKMLVRIFRKLWMHLLISFCDDYTIEGFEKTKAEFNLPENLRELDPQVKRKFTICNLFANQSLSIKDICVVLDASKHQVIDVLIENNLIKERRQKPALQTAIRQMAEGPPAFSFIQLIDWVQPIFSSWIEDIGKMFVRIFRKFWMHMLISFNDDYTIEGFEKTKTKFNLPENLRELDPQVKREFTICNLFANQDLSIRDICVVLDTSKHQVIDVLIENNLIKERRRENRAKQKGPLSITPDENTRESTNPDPSYESKNSGRAGAEAESNFHPETSMVSNSAANESKAKADSGHGRRIA
jgi:phage antirepressor YoqD-like protein